MGGKTEKKVGVFGTRANVFKKGRRGILLGKWMRLVKRKKMNKKRRKGRTIG